MRFRIVIEILIYIRGNIHVSAVLLMGGVLSETSAPVQRNKRLLHFRLRVRLCQ